MITYTWKTVTLKLEDFKANPEFLTGLEAKKKLVRLRKTSIQPNQITAFLRNGFYSNLIKKIKLFNEALKRGDGDFALRRDGEMREMERSWVFWLIKRRKRL